MMSRKLLIVFLVVVCLSGCGAKLKDTIAPAETPDVKRIAVANQAELREVRNVAIFPFADYSHQQDFIKDDYWGGNIRILEEVTDHFVAHGISVAVQEDVNTLLVNYKIIQPIASQYLLYGSDGDNVAKHRTKVIGTPEYDLVNVEHSEDMKSEIIEVIRDEMALEQSEKPPIQTPVLQGATVGLSRGKIIELGEILGVDLIVRGRIVEYGFKGVDTYNPLKRGFLPVLIEPMKDALLGVYDPKEYESDLEDVDFSRLGEGPGFLFGQKTEDEIEGTWDVLMEHSFGSLSNLHPRKKDVTSIVQIRMYAQDAKTGDVLWSNRAETEYSPPTGISFKEKHPKTMFDENIERCVRLLMDDLFGCVTLAAKKKIELTSQIDDETQVTVSGQEGSGENLEKRLAENKILMGELQDKIGDLENNRKILLQQIKDKTFITLPNAILFPSGYAEISQQGSKTLKAIGGVLERYPNRSICIEGHTDSVPIGPKIKDKYATNWELSAARAITVKNYMVRNFKFDQRNMAVKGYGPFKPVASNNTQEGKSKNRRVVIVVGPRL